MSRKQRLILITAIIIGITIILVLIFGGQRHFYRRSIREIETGIKSLGDLSAAAVVSLVIVSTVIPPLPIPIPLVEIASGLVFGLWYGFLLNWFSQILSSVIAYYIAQHIGKKILKRFSKYKFLEFYINYIKRSGPIAVFITRAALVSPFNIVSFLAGLTEMKFSSFLIATSLGTVSESLLYAFIGSIIRTTRLSLGYVFALVLIIAGLGMAATYIMIELANRKKK